MPIQTYIDCANTYKDSETKSRHENPYLITHTGVLKLAFIHNHSLSSAHALSFRDVLEETKQAFYSVFEVGHSPSARHVREQALYIQAESETDAQLSLADRAHNPMVQDICRLFIK